MWASPLIFCVFIGVCHGLYLLEEKKILQKQLNETENHVVPIPRNTEILYYFYGQSGPPTPIQSDVTEIEGFNHQQPVVIIIHDHRGDHTDDFSTTLRDAFTSNLEIHNVIVMDWSTEAALSFNEVVQNIRTIADDIATLMNSINQIPNNEGSLQEHDYHLVGFGIGAHLAGVAGHLLPNAITIRRITGLDPPGRYFGENSLRLEQGTAEYVEVIHTNGGLLGNGIGKPIGDVDFFVNGGFNQPGCITNTCCHNWSYQIFAASFNHNFDGNKCTSMTQVILNTCRGRPLNLGGADMNKGQNAPLGIYRVTVRRV